MLESEAIVSAAKDILKMFEKSIIPLGKNLPKFPAESLCQHQQRPRCPVPLGRQGCAGEKRQQPQREGEVDAVALGERPPQRGRREQIPVSEAAW